MPRRAVGVAARTRLQQERESCRRCASSSKATGLQRGAKTGTCSSRARTGSADMAPSQDARYRSPTAVLGTTDAAICNISRSSLVPLWTRAALLLQSSQQDPTREGTLATPQKKELRSGPECRRGRARTRNGTRRPKALTAGQRSHAGSHERTKRITLCVVRPVPHIPAYHVPSYPVLDSGHLISASLPPGNSGPQQLPTRFLTCTRYSLLPAAPNSTRLSSTSTCNDLRNILNWADNNSTVAAHGGNTPLSDGTYPKQPSLRFSYTDALLLTCLLPRPIRDTTEAVTITRL